MYYKLILFGTYGSPVPYAQSSFNENMMKQKKIELTANDTFSFCLNKTWNAKHHITSRNNNKLISVGGPGIDLLTRMSRNQPD